MSKYESGNMNLIFIQDNDLKRLQIRENASVKDVIVLLNETSHKIALVVNRDEELLGTISDGDIRRGILNGCNLNSICSQVMGKNPLTVSMNTIEEVIINLMIEKNIQHIPVIGTNRKLIGLYILNNLKFRNIRKNKFVIMAGGKGTRLLPLTEDLPKPMLSIAGKPILEHIIVQAKSEGFTNFVLAVYHLGSVIENYFKDGSSWGVKISYLHEHIPLGTAGALSLMSPIPDEPIVVTNGDVLSRVKYSEVLDHHIQHRADATMAIQTHEWQNPFGVVLTNGLDIVGYNEKPLNQSLINAGVYVLEPKTLSLINPDEPCHMPQLFESIRNSKLRTIAFPIHEAWIDVGRPDDYMKASENYFYRNEKEVDY